VGHTSFNWALNHISPTLVALFTLCEPIGASILGYFFFQEIPSFLVILGAIIILIGVAIAVLGSQSKT
jgi:drug/metabolite transporter (DMT)-like permease